MLKMMGFCWSVLLTAADPNLRTVTAAEERLLFCSAEEPLTPLINVAPKAISDLACAPAFPQTPISEPQREVHPGRQRFVASPLGSQAGPALQVSFSILPFLS